MQRVSIFAGMVICLCIGIGTFAAEKGEMAVKVGDMIYVCNCGEKCPCQMMSRQGGNCSCGKAMSKGKVTRVDPGKSFVLVNGKEQSYRSGKFTCACGPACKCDSVSQTPGKCACGVSMKPIAAK